MYDNDLKNFMNNCNINHNYSFDLIPEDLGFFEMKKLMQVILDDIPSNHLVFVENNKILSVELDESDEYWLVYEKAKFFIKLFQSNEKFILINENDEFFYGYIDRFPCVFEQNFERAKNAIQEYAGGEFVEVFGVGEVDRKCHKVVSYDEIIANHHIEDTLKIDYLAEDSALYDQEKPDFNNLILNYLLKFNESNHKTFIIRNCIMLSCSFLFIAFKFV